MPHTDNSDLDDLLAESQAKAPPEEISLEDLLAESVALAREASIGKTMRAKQRQGTRLSDEDLLRLREWENRHEWRALANVALFDRTTCDGCGKHQTVFTALMQRQEHRHLRETVRWTSVESVNPKLPNEVAVRKYRVGMCPACCERAGFTFKVMREFEG